MPDTSQQKRATVLHNYRIYRRAGYRPVVAFERMLRVRGYSSAYRAWAERYLGIARQRADALPYWR